jgi:hypothetical protein
MFDARPASLIARGALLMSKNVLNRYSLCVCVLLLQDLLQSCARLCVLLNGTNVN